MLRVRFAPYPTGLSHIGLEALGRETCLRRIRQAIGKLKTSWAEWGQTHFHPLLRRKLPVRE